MRQREVRSEKLVEIAIYLVSAYRWPLGNLLVSASIRLRAAGELDTLIGTSKKGGSQFREDTRNHGKRCLQHINSGKSRLGYCE